MSTASRLIEKLFVLSGAAKDISAKKFYGKLRKNAIRYQRGDRILPRFFGVKTEKGIYCGMRYYLFTPKEVDSVKSVMYVHGSGYMNGHGRCHLRFAVDIARNTHAKVYFPIYPKLPNSTVLSTYALLNNFYAFLRKRSEVFLVGDSSGGALVLALAAEKEEIRDVIAISPWVSLKIGEEGRAVSTDVMLSLSVLDRAARLWAYDLDPENVKLSPINGDYAGKRLLIFSGEKEVFRPDIARFCREKEKGGASVTYVEGAGQQHCYPLMPTPEGRDARECVYRRLHGALYGEGE